MAEIRRAGGAGNSRGKAMQLVGSVVSAVPGVGQVVGPIIQGLGAADEAKASKQGAGAIGGALSGAIPGAGGPMERRLEAAGPPIDVTHVQQLQDSLKVAQQMPPQVRQQTEPVLTAAYNEAMRRRMGGYA